MMVRANGKTLLSDFDIVADAGASLAADTKVFSDITPAADGLLHLEFAGEEGKQATLSAIEILPGFQGHMRPVRILARQTPYYSNDSHWWSPDNYFEGGQLAAYATAATGTDDPELFESERWGNFSYAIPVTPGKYVLTLYFAGRQNSPGEMLNSESKGRGNRTRLQRVLQRKSASAEFRPREGSERDGWHNAQICRVLRRMRRENCSLVSSQSRVRDSRWPRSTSAVAFSPE